MQKGTDIYWMDWLGLDVGRRLNVVQNDVQEGTTSKSSREKQRT
jgi:hypothetical protein